MKTLRNTEPKAMKEHKCNFCLENINVGEIYYSQTNVLDSEIYTWKTHLSCSLIAGKLDMYDYCDEGVTSDDFWDYINEALYSMPQELIPEKPTPKEKLDLVKNYFLNNQK